MRLTCTIITLANRTLGHAGVGRFLAQEIARSGEDVRFLTDQSTLLDRIGFTGNAEPIETLSRALGRGEGGPHVLLLDTIPFRRENLVGQLSHAIRGREVQVLCGHTGWLPAAAMNKVSQWRELLAFLNIRRVLVYHDVDVCEGRCHISQLSKLLRIDVIHTGLLMPKCRAVERTAYSLAFSAGGGTNVDDLISLANKIARRNPKWQVDIFLGPYASMTVRPGEGLHVMPFNPQLAQALASYSGSIARSGYGSCVDHIACQTPVQMLPLPNAEQQANAAWARRFLGGGVRLSAGYELITVPSSPKYRPRPLDWSEIRMRLL